MPSEKIIDTDVLVIGGSMAGGFAAIKAREQGLNVTLVDKAYAGKSGGSSFAGGYFLVFNPDWGHDLKAYMEYINGTGEYLNNRDWTEIILKDSYSRFQDLLSWGVEFTEEDGKLYRHKWPFWENVHMRRRKFTQTIRKKAFESGIKIEDRVMITELIKQDGKILGAIGFHSQNGDSYVFKAKATVLATGNGGFKQAGLPTAYWTFDGEAMAYRAGAEISGREFGMKGAMVNAAFPHWRGHGMAIARYKKYVNAAGVELGPGMTTGSQLFASIAFDAHAGNAPIYWNLDDATNEDITSMQQHQESTGTLIEAERAGIYVSRGGKFPMVGGDWLGSSTVGGGGGVWPIDTNCATGLPGLYAAGDCCATMAGGSLYAGAGDALCAASVTGTRAGLGAAGHALQSENITIDEAELARLKKIVFAPTERRGGFSPGWVTQLLQNIMVPYFISQIKHGERMQAALNSVEFIRDHLNPKLTAKDPHELRLAHETRNMTVNAETILRASIFRSESRGAHYREDYPLRDDPAWLAWVKMKDEEGKMKVWKEPIPQEWWPDLSEPYNERYPFRFPGEAGQSDVRNG